MSGAAETGVSAQGQMNLPEDVLSRWGLEKGGVVALVDLGEAVLVAPGGLGGWCQMGVWCAGVGGGGAGAVAGRALWCGGVCRGLVGSVLGVWVPETRPWSLTCRDAPTASPTHATSKPAASS